MVHPFTISVDPAILKNLQDRLASTRWPDQVDNEQWQAGTNEAYLQQLCTYWQHDFDWKKQQDYLNTFSHFKATIDNYGLHFIHQKGEGNQSIPLLMTHGWPDSFVRFLKIIPLLTKADENGLSFDVIVPSIPGHGFSDIPTETGMNNKQIASLFAKLMTDELGYTKFMAHGGDAGSEITEQIALYHADSLLGIHLTDIPYHHIIVTDETKLGRNEKKYKEDVTQWQQTEGAYNAVQSTKPQTLAYGLNDSPAGLAAWIIEKFYAWSDCDGDLESCFTKDELVTNITIYWVTQTINSSFRRYRETMTDMMQEMFNPLQKLNPFDKTGTKPNVPTAVAQFQTDLLPPQDFANQFFSIHQWNKMPKGGHFAAMEQPDLLADDIRAFVRTLKVATP
ncbi:epoxide hydrolase family protein [Spirosoma endophyticum]|uniref:Pimeloyl-ACP methyl ester carboxylesterase n=1 Tax=Spirosoma endophyticum TaxID=662367 RepID=A0A1I1F0Z4_9BACT|nr:epoxide hydrolase family protein [Spirosoma endophyticum]SFB92562.1 Pimeloyl-ACP methyl ester carboxylesterase [Spirosoma endophyticum]